MFRGPTFLILVVLASVGNVSPMKEKYLANKTKNYLKNQPTVDFETHEARKQNTEKKYCYSSHKVSEVMANIMNSSAYDVHTVPSFDDGKPLEIKLALTVLVFRDLKEVDMTYTVDFFLRTKWTDRRLKNSLDCVFTMTMGKKHPAQVIWVPDTMIENSVTSYLHEVLTNNHKIDISPNGDVFWSTRITVKAMCDMNLVKYPRDKQTCSIVLLSYAYTTELVKYVWEESNPVGVMDKTLSQFDVTSFDKTSYNLQYVAGEYSILKATFVFERRLGHYLIQVYIPCIFLVILAGLSFWVDAKATPARVALSLTTQLTIATIWSAANSNMPPVSYVKAIDIYFLTSFGFVLATLLEYILVLNYEVVKKSIMEKLQKRRRTESFELEEQQPYCKHGHVMNRKSLLTAERVDDEDDASSLNHHYHGNGTVDKKLKCDYKRDTESTVENDKKTVSNIDRITKYVYPIAYITFNVVYWYQLKD